MKISNELKAVILPALKKFQLKTTIYPHYGLCINLHLIIRDYYDNIDEFLERPLFSQCGLFLKESFKTWDHYSGSEDFPIGDNPIEAEKLFFDCCDYWDESSEYGLLRFELIDHLIACINNTK